MKKPDCTGERLIKMETEITYIKEKIDEHGHKLDAFIDSADKKYASKLTEKVVYGLIGMICVAVLGAIIHGALS